MLSDRPLEPPVLHAEGDTVQRGQDHKIEARIPGARGLHSLKVRVKDPHGEEMPWFSQSGIVEEGSAAFEFPIAHNEVIGPWTVTDLYTGESVDASFRVE